MPPDSLDPGDEVDGFVIVRKLREGGMGAVYEVERRGDGSPVALKVCGGGHCDELVRERFVREIDLAKSVRHRNLVRVLGSGETPQGRLYFTMELLDGEDLGSVLDRQALDPWAVGRVGRATAAGLAAAHEVGIVHRDVKPANVFLCADWTVKLVDFGLAICVNADALGRMTAAKTIVGTPSYMAPEQVGGRRDEDLRTDVWGLGATLYHAVAGRPPYVAKSNLVLADRILHCEPDTLPAEVPAWLAHAIRKALRKSKEERWQCMRAFALALSAQ